MIRKITVDFVKRLSICLPTTHMCEGSLLVLHEISCIDTTHTNQSSIHLNLHSTFTLIFYIVIYNMPIIRICIVYILIEYKRKSENEIFPPIIFWLWLLIVQY